MLRLIMEACITLHKMIVEDEAHDNVDDIEPVITMVNIERGGVEMVAYVDYMAGHAMYQSQAGHYALQSALVDHLWDRFGSSA